MKNLNANVRTILTTAYEVDENSKIKEYAEKGIIDLLLAKPVKLRGCVKRLVTWFVFKTLLVIDSNF